jgi:hypothetical protein
MIKSDENCKHLGHKVGISISHATFRFQRANAVLSVL